MASEKLAATQYNVRVEVMRYDSGPEEESRTGTAYVLQEFEHEAEAIRFVEALTLGLPTIRQALQLAYLTAMDKGRQMRAEAAATAAQLISQPEQETGYVRLAETFEVHAAACAALLDALEED